VGVTADDNTDSSYDNFLNVFSELHDTFFQPKTVKFNKNFHKQERWMTQGLLISRKTKIILERAHAINPSEITWNKFKNYRNVYNSTVRMCKKMFYAHELDANCKNLKKTWSILNDVLKKPKNKQQISSINSNGELITDPTLIANTFNNFFTTIADEIANLINPVPSPNSNLTDGPGAGNNLPDSAVDAPNLFNMSDVPLTDDEIISSIDSLED
jgi:hypothetical protein